MDIRSHFNQHFEIIQCRQIDEIKACQRIRYQCYCDEHHFLDSSQYPDKLEHDEFDEHSAHSCIVHSKTQLPIATVRLVLHRQAKKGISFPIEEFEILRRMKRDKKWLAVPKQSIGEISRFAICKEFRRRIEDHENLHGISTNTFSLPSSDRRCAADITLGLFKAIVTDSNEQQLTHWYAIIEPSLIRLLSRFGIRFCEVGPCVNYHGLRQPCIAYIPNVLKGIYQNNESVWQFITDDGQLYGDTYLYEKEDEGMA